MNEKLRQIYDLYKENGLVGNATFEQFANANEDQQQAIWELGAENGLVGTAEPDDFKAAFKESKPKEPGMLDRAMSGISDFFSPDKESSNAVSNTMMGKVGAYEPEVKKKAASMASPSAESLSELQFAAARARGEFVPPTGTLEEQAKAVGGTQSYMGGTAPLQPAKKSEKKTYVENLGTNLMSGLNQLNKMIVSIPETVYDAFSIPQNAIAYATGWDIATNSDKLRETLGVENPVIDYYNKEGERLQQEIQKYNEENYKSSSIYENIKDGNYGDAFELLGSGIVNSAPVSIAMMVGGATLSPTQLVTAGTVGFYGENYDQLKEENPDASEIELNIKALTMSAAETVFSAVGEGQIGAVYRDIIKKEGVEAGTQIFKNGLVDMYKEAIKKYGVPVGLLGEGLEEAATQITQNMVSGKPAFQGAADAFILGGGSGAAFTAPITLKNAKDRLTNEVAKIDDKKQINAILGNNEAKLNTLFDVSKDDAINEAQFKIASLGKSRDLLEKDLKESVRKGVITQDQANQSLYVFDKTQQVAGQLRDVNIDEPSKVKVANLLKERDALTEKMQGKDEALSVLEKERIGQINEEIKKTIIDSNAKAQAAQPSYSINGKEMSEQEFTKAVSEMSPEDVKKADIKASNATEGVTTLLKEVATRSGVESAPMMETTAPAAPAAEAQPAKPKTIDEIQDDDLKSDLNWYKDFLESDLKIDEEDYNEAKEDFDKKNPIVRFFSKKPSYEQYTKYTKNKLELLKNNPEKFISDAVKEYEESKKEYEEDGEEFPQSKQETLDSLKKQLSKLQEENAIQKPTTEEGVLRTEQPEVGLPKMGEGNAQEKTTQEGIAPAKPQEVTDEARIERRDKNRNIIDAEGSTYWADISFNNTKIGDEIHYTDNKGVQHKTKVKDVVDGKFVFENGQTRDDVSSYMNITAEDAWFAKNKPTEAAPAKPQEVEPNIILGGLNQGWKAVTNDSFDVRSNSDVMNLINRESSFAKIVDYKGKKYAIVGLNLEPSIYKPTDGGRDNYSFALAEYNETTPKNILDILENQAKENIKNVYPRFSDKDTVKPITEKDAELNVLQPTEAKQQEAKPTEAKPIEQELAELEQMFPTEGPTGENRGVAASDTKAMEEIASRSTDERVQKVVRTAQKLTKTLKSLFPNAEINIHETEESYNGAMEEINATKESNGNFAFGVVDGKPFVRIDINANTASSRDVAHEVAHAVLAKTFGDNQKLFQSFQEKIAKVISTDSNQKLIDFANNPVYREQGVTYEEYMAELKAILSEEGSKIELSTAKKIAAVINEYVSKITKGAFKPFQEVTDVKQVIDFVNKVTEAMAKGEAIDVEAAKGKAGERISRSSLREQEKITNFAKDEKGQIRPEQGGNRTGRYSSGSLTPLKGAPTFQGASGPDPQLVTIAEKYAKENGIDLKRQAEYVSVDVDRAKRIADAFEKMEHNPQDPKVREAYADLIAQTKKQYQALADAGYVFTFFDSNTDPYKGNPVDAMRDLRANKKMAVYGTYDGYGTEGITKKERENNPMLEDTGLKWKDQNGVEHPVMANDLFRAVHDAFGHGLEGAGFRAQGEENAWQAHVKLFTGPAVGAITSETRGQNSWLNFGPYGEQNKKAKVEDTVFADNKIGLMPEWTWTEGRAKDMEITSRSSIKAFHGSPYEIDKFKTEKIGTGEGAQAFGWGLYFTDLKNIAKQYADKLSNYKVDIPNKYYESLKNNFDYKSGGIARSLEEVLFSKNIVEQGLDNAIINLEISAERFGDSNSEIAQERRRDLTLLKELKQKGIEVKKNANLYDVTLHEGKTPDQYTYLEWDKPLSDNQIKKLSKIKEIADVIDAKIQNKRKLENKFADSGIKKEFQNDISGQQLYEGLSKKLGSPKAASLFLLENGIDGVKYPAESIARGATSENARGFNYVIFDENAATINAVSRSSLRTAEQVDKMVKDARASGYSEKAIEEFLKKRGVDQTIIDKSLGKKEAGTKVVTNEEMMPGYDRMMAQVDAIIEKGLNRNTNQQDILNNVISYIQGSKAYENATAQQQEEIIRDVKKAFGEKIKPAPSAKKILGFLKDVKKVTVDEMSLLKQRLKDMAKGAKTAESAINKASKNLTESLNDLRKKGDITTKQMIAVLRKFSKTNLLDDASVDKFVNYMTKVFADAEYADKISKAYTQLKVAKKNIKTKIGIAEDLHPLLSKIFSVNPNLIPDAVFEKYLGLVDMFGQKKQVLKLQNKQDVINLANEIIDAMDEELSLSEELADRFSNYADKVVDADGKVDYAATIQAMVKDDTITEDEAKIMRKYKSKIFPSAKPTPKTDAELAQEKQDLLTALNGVNIDTENLPTNDEREVARKLDRLIRSDAVNNMTNEQLTNLLKVIDNINNGYLSDYAQLMLERLNGLNNGSDLKNALNKAKLLSLTKVYANLKSKLTRKDAISTMVVRSPLYYIDQVFGNFKSKDIFNSLFKSTSEAHALFDSSITAIQNKLDKAEEDVAKSLSKKILGINFKNIPNKVIMSKFKMMTYLVQLEYQSNPNSKQVNPASDYLKATIKHIDEGKSSFGERDANMLQKILDTYKDTDGNIDIDKLYNSFNSAEKKAIATIREINESLREKAVHTAAIIRGDKINPLENYVHLNVLHDTQPNDAISGITSAEAYNNTLKPSTKAKSLIARTGKVAPLNFDVFASAHRGAKFVLMDYYLTEPIRTARKTINEATAMMEKDGRIPKEKRQILNAVSNAFEETTENILNNVFVTNSRGDEVVNYMAKNGYRAVLASVPKFIGELTSNIGGALFMDPKAFATGYKYRDIVMSSDAVKILSNVASKQTNRIFPNEALAGRLIDSSIMSQASGIKGGRAKSDVANVIHTIYNNSLKKYKNIVEASADALISTPDKMVMRPTWIGSFANEFKKLTGKDVDFNKIANNDEAYMLDNKDAIDDARDVADQLSVFIGTTKNPYMDILKGKVKANQSPLARGFNMFNNYMTSFAIYEYTTARTGIMAAMGNGSLTRKQGVALLAGVTTRMVLYTLLTQTLSSAMVGLFVDDEDEEDEKSLLQKVGQALTSTFTSLILGRDFGNATKNIVNYGLERVNENYLDFLRKGDYDPYKDAIQYSVIPPDVKGKKTTIADYIINMSGPFAPTLKTADLIARKLSEDPKKTEASINRKEGETNVRIPLEVLGNLGLVPLYKDIRKITMKSIYKDLENVDKQYKVKETEKRAENVEKIKIINRAIDSATDQAVVNELMKMRREARMEMFPEKMSDEAIIILERKKKREKASYENLLGGYDTKTDLKRYNPDLYEQNFGEDSKYYQTHEAEMKAEKLFDKAKRDYKDERYGYQAPAKKKVRAKRKKNSDGSYKSSYFRYSSN